MIKDIKRTNFKIGSGKTPFEFDSTDNLSKTLENNI